FRQWIVDSAQPPPNCSYFHRRGNSMKRNKTFGRKTRTGNHRLFDRPSARVRRRATEVKMESLQERTLLSSAARGVPPPVVAHVPAGLGVAYTTMSEQAHGVGLNTLPSNQFVPGSTTTTSASNSVTMAELEAYLKQLKASYDTNQTSPSA